MVLNNFIQRALNTLYVQGRNLRKRQFNLQIAVKKRLLYMLFASYS